MSHGTPSLLPSLSMARTLPLASSPNVSRHSQPTPLTIHDPHSSPRVLSQCLTALPAYSPHYPWPALFPLRPLPMSHDTPSLLPSLSMARTLPLASSPNVSRHSQPTPLTIHGPHSSPCVLSQCLTTLPAYSPHYPWPALFPLRPLPMSHGTPSLLPSLSMARTLPLASSPNVSRHSQPTPLTIHDPHSSPRVLSQCLTALPAYSPHYPWPALFPLRPLPMSHDTPSLLPSLSMARTLPLASSPNVSRHSQPTPLTIHGPHSSPPVLSQCLTALPAYSPHYPWPALFPSRPLPMSHGTPSLLPSLSMARTLPLASSPNVSRHSQPTPLTIHGPHSSPCVLSQCLTTLPAYSPHYPWPALFPLRPLPMSHDTPSLLPSLSMARTLPLASSPNVSRHSQPTPLTIHGPHSSPRVLSQCLTALPAYSPHYPWPALFPLRPLPMSHDTPSLLPSLSMARTLPLASSPNVSRHSQPTPLTIHGPHSSPRVLSQCLTTLPAYSPHYPWPALFPLRPLPMSHDTPSLLPSLSMARTLPLASSPNVSRHSQTTPLTIHGPHSSPCVLSQCLTTLPAYSPHYPWPALFPSRPLPMSHGTPSRLPSLSMARTLPLASSPNVSRHSQPTPLTIHGPHSSPRVLSQCLPALPAYSPHYPWPALFPSRPLPMSPGTPSLLPSLSMARTLPLASSPNVSRHSQPTPLTIHGPHSSPRVLSQCLPTLPAYSPHYPWPALFPSRPLPMSPDTPSLLPSLSMARTLPLASSPNVSRHSQPTPLTIHDPHSSPCVLSQCLPTLPAYSPHYPWPALFPSRPLPMSPGTPSLLPSLSMARTLPLASSPNVSRHSQPTPLTIHDPHSSPCVLSQCLTTLPAYSPHYPWPALFPLRPLPMSHGTPSRLPSLSMARTLPLASSPNVSRHSQPTLLTIHGPHSSPCVLSQCLPTLPAYSPHYP